MLGLQPYYYVLADRPKFKFLHIFFNAVSFKSVFLVLQSDVNLSA